MFATPAGAPFTARLTTLDGKRLDQFDLPNQDAAERARRAVEAGDFTVRSVERRRVRRNPPAPFTTSTLQQEASRKLGLGAQQTMRIAQQLYEGIDIGGETVGLITYMRTDGVQMAREAIDRDPRPCRRRVRRRLPARRAARIHEQGQERAGGARGDPPDRRRADAGPRGARPLARAAPALRAGLEARRRLADAVGRARPGERSMSRTRRARGCARPARSSPSTASSSCIARARTRRRKRTASMLPPMAERDPLRRGKVAADQHFTQPPPRYSEASLVKKMEELGIGRPSTYASILTVLRDRNYVRMENRRFIPEDRGRLVTAFLTSFFERYVDTGFTAVAGGAARRHLGRAGRLARGDARLLGGVLARRRADQGPQDLRRHRRARRGSRPAFLPAQGGRNGPARLPGLRQRAPRPEARALWQLHRLLELPGLPVHAPARDRERRGPGGGHAEGGHARARRASRDGRGDHGAARAVRALRPAGRAGGEGEAAARLAAARHGGRDDHARAGGRACSRCRASSASIRSSARRSRPASGGSALT